MVDSGLTIPPWSGRRVTEAVAWFKAQCRRARRLCSICSQPIDYSLEWPHPDSFALHHDRSRKEHPELAWVRSNWRPAHKACNESAGTGAKAERRDLGVTSQAW